MTEEEQRVKEEEKPKTNKRTRVYTEHEGTRGLNDDELKLCFEYFNEHWHSPSVLYERNKFLFFLGISTGFRINELLNLKVSHVYDTNVQRVRHEVYMEKKNMKGKRKGRRLPLAPESVRNTIDEYIKTMALNTDPDAYLFSAVTDNAHAGHMSTRQARDILKRCFTKLKLENIERLSTHTLRKTFALRTYKKLDHDLELTRVAMGHGNIQMTSKYIKKDYNELAKIMEKSE